ncbi:MAG: bifunctional DNA primase/polymerase [Pseudonocardia sp.]|nr:bifunctional DNA primase/polymerase [Pseudonocardia sp.]
MSAAEIIEGYITAGVGVLPLHAMKGGRCTCGRPSGSGPGDCHSPAKHPLTRSGKDDATTDPTLVAEWLARWPGCNWGVRPPVGVVVVDVDPRNGGDDELAKLQERHGALPATLTARTGSGGLHIWLSYNGPTRGRLCTGVDIKSNSGYLVAPPSVHECGGTYEWIDQRPAAYAPAWVKAILNPPTVRRSPTGAGSGNIAGLVRFVETAGEGERNRRLYWAACRAVERGLDTEPLIDAGVGVGLVHMAAVATVKSAEKAPPSARRHDPSSVEFLRSTTRKQAL